MHLTKLIIINHACPVIAISRSLVPAKPAQIPSKQWMNAILKFWLHLLANQFASVGKMTFAPVTRSKSLTTRSNGMKYEKPLFSWLQKKSPITLGS